MCLGLVVLNLRAQILILRGGVDVYILIRVVGLGRSGVHVGHILTTSTMQLSKNTKWIEGGEPSSLVCATH